MKKVIVVIVLAVVLFGLSAGGTLFLQKLKTEKTKPAGDESAAVDTPPKDKGAAPEGRGNGADTNKGLLGRREYNPEADATVQQANRLRDQQSDLSKREEQFKVRVKNLELIASDIRGGREEMDKMRNEILAEKKVVDEMLAVVEKDLRQLEEKQRVAKADREIHEKRITEIEKTRFDNVRKFAPVSDAMAPTEAATILMQMVDSGNLDGAALVLVNMKDRKAADVLSQMPDKGVAAQLIERMMSLKQAPPAPTTAGRANR